MQIDAVIEVAAETYRGYSAYEIAVQQGFEGNEGEWLASLHAVTVNGQNQDENGNISLDANSIPVSGTEANVSVAQALQGKASSVDGAPSSSGAVVLNAVRYTSQTLTASQQTQARTNIGALGTSDVVDNLTSDDAAKPLSAKQGKALKTLIDNNPGGGVQTVNSVSPDSNGNVLLTAANVGAIPVSSGAGAHNAIYRGQSLGTSVTSAQWAVISDGTFDGLYIGDYWTIGEVVWRIAAFDYYYLTGDGDTGCTTHHVTIVPDTALYNAKMNDTNTTTGAYVGSSMYTSGLGAAKTTINNAFGTAHILNHRKYLDNAVTNGYASGGAWYDSTAEIMAEQNVYGCKINANNINGTNQSLNYTIDKSQYPLFAYRHDLITTRQWYWLRDVASTAHFCRVDNSGLESSANASDVSGVRPSFSIKG